jgi:hypothetical protein
MRCIKPPTPLPAKTSDPIIFLAGTIDNGAGIEWQNEVCDKLRNTKLVFLNPRRAAWDPSGTLKIKMGSSLIVICFINLLQSYYKTGELNWNVLGMKASIFFMFVLGTLALTYIDSHTHHDEPKQDVAPAKTPEATKH